VPTGDRPPSAPVPSRTSSTRPAQPVRLVRGQPPHLPSKQRVTALPEPARPDLRPMVNRMVNKTGRPQANRVRLEDLWSPSNSARFDRSTGRSSTASWPVLISPFRPSRRPAPARRGVDGCQHRCAPWRSPFTNRELDALLVRADQADEDAQATPSCSWVVSKCSPTSSPQAASPKATLGTETQDRCAAAVPCSRSRCSRSVVTRSRCSALRIRLTALRSFA